MDYQLQYDMLMAVGSRRGNRRRKGFELHHVIPSCMGGSNKKWNKSLLTKREHFVAHKLLTKIYPDHCSLQFALWRMATRNKSTISSRAYESARGEAIKAATSYQNALVALGLHHWQTNEARIQARERSLQLVLEGKHPWQKPDEANCLKRSKRQKQRYAEGKLAIANLGELNPGKKPENRLKSSRRNKQLHAEGKLALANLGENNPSKKPENRAAASERGKLLWADEGNPMNKPENRAKVSERNKQLVQCTECCKVGGETSMKHYHFDNCPLLLNTGASCDLSESVNWLPCQDCDRFFSSKQGLTRHKTEKHKLASQPQEELCAY